MLFNNRSIHLSLAAICLFAHDSTAQQCPRGAFVETGKQCPCLKVDTGCKIVDPAFPNFKGENCSTLVVTADGNGKYPEVEVEYSWEMCNENSFDIELKQNFAKFFDWTKKPGSKAESIKNPRFPLGGKFLKAGECLKQTKVHKIDTTNRYTIATQLEGFVVDDSADGRKNSQNDYCYAFGNESVSFKKGKCKVDTEATCKTTDGKLCQDFINEQNPAECKDFEASFTWKACNNESYQMKIFSDASNVKIAEKIGGRRSNEVIANIQGPINPGECEKVELTKTISTCFQESEKLFYSINLQGSKQNGKFWFECQDFTFKNLQRREAITRQPAPAPAPSKGKGGKGNGRNMRKRRATRRNL
jgi:hypothetical protein